MNDKYINSCFNYTGSKYKLLEQIIPHFDFSKENFVDLFTGGGSVYINVLDKYKNVIVNDIIKELIGIHKSIYESDSIIEDVKKLCPGKHDKEGYLALRDDYNNNPTPAKLWALMLCCTNNMMRFNKQFKFNQTHGVRTFNDSTESKINEFKSHIRNFDNIYYHSKTFKDVQIMENTMYYIDPPYTNSEAGYNAYWNKGDDILLTKYCNDVNKAGSTFMVSGVLEHDNKECILLNNLISEGYNVVELDFNYNKVSRKGDKETREVIIKNY